MILFSYLNHPDYKLILASNRDEFYERPTRPLDFWGADKKVLAGKDERSLGTWLGVTTHGKIAAITNYRDPASVKDVAPSRGLLVSRYLESDKKPGDYLEGLRSDSLAYNGFNLLAGDTNSLYYFSNRRPYIESIKPGIHGLSNAFLDTPWPKVETGKNNLDRILKRQRTIDIEDLFDLLADDHHPCDHDLPDTGIGLAWERMLSPVFIKSEIYGTRASSIILIDNHDRMTFIERSFNLSASGESRIETRRFFQG
ncbi:MAG: NRDE family protein [Desulfobacteraceae bacterium]|nr:NRDE family protein [Desulfobacteraceae bacterium]